MLVVNSLVVKADFTARQLDVVEREERRRFIRFRFGQHGFEQVGKVVAIIRQTHDIEFRIDQANLADHQAATKERGGLDIEVQLVESDEGLRPLALLHRHPVERQRQRVRIDTDAADRDGPVQGGGKLFDGDRFDNRRQDEEADYSDHGQSGQNPQCIFLQSPGMQDVF